jgi:hypothetical protein
MANRDYHVTRVVVSPLMLEIGDPLGMNTNHLPAR